MVLLATTPGSDYTVWLILIWAIVIPGIAIVALLAAFGQTAGEREENLSYARGERPDDDDVVVVDDEYH